MFTILTYLNNQLTGHQRLFRVLTTGCFYVVNCKNIKVVIPLLL